MKLSWAFLAFAWMLFFGSFLDHGITLNIASLASFATAAVCRSSEDDDANPET